MHRPICLNLGDCSPALVVCPRGGAKQRRSMPGERARYPRTSCPSTLQDRYRVVRKEPACGGDGYGRSLSSVYSLFSSRDVWSERREARSGTITVVDTDAADIPVDDEVADTSCLPEGSNVREAIVAADTEGLDRYTGESLAPEEYERVVESSETGCGTQFVEYNDTVYRVNWNN